MKTILCYGDSNTFATSPGTQGERIPFPERWTGILFEKFYPEALVVEEGLGGRNTVFEDPFNAGKNGLTFLPVALASSRPVDLVVLMLGTNDLRNFFPRYAYRSARGVSMLIDEIKRFDNRVAPPPQILLVSPIHIGEKVGELQFGDVYDKKSVEMSKQLKPLYQKVAEEKQVHFLAASDYCVPSERDELHMDRDNHKIFAQILEKKIREILF